MSRRSIIYIDGFNLYYGAVRGTRHKWLDIQRMCERLRQDDDIQAIRYFTALVEGPKRTNQEAYLRALSNCSKLEVILGKFKRKQLHCRVASCAHPGSRIYTGTEEKRTDVNIALRILDDTLNGRAERLVLISGDSDLVPALEMAKAHSPSIELVVYIPSRNPVRGAAVELRAAADKDRTLPMDLIARSQFPNLVLDGRGGRIAKPVTW